jgi:H+-translocating NAD(P) transhydrogenase subunit alpha
MKEQLGKAIIDASEISSKANALSLKLQEIGIANESAVISGVDPFILLITIFTLACFVGYYVVWKVTPSLHTPLMSITNAISGIIIVGAMIASSAQMFGISSIFGLVATFFAAINIFGGFIVTERMLGMFKKK